VSPRAGCRSSAWQPAHCSYRALRLGSDTGAVPPTRASRRRRRPCVLPALLITLALPASAHAASQVVGGTVPAAGSWPYATLVTASLGSQGAALCTGVVIAPTAVLTAAHCTVDDKGDVLQPSAFSVTTGRLVWNDETTGQVLGVSKVDVDPAYAPASGRNDLAVLELSAATTAAPIRLATTDDLARLPAGSAALIAGFGQTSSSQVEPQYQLLQGSVTLMAASACTVIYQAFDSASQLCVDSPGHSVEACHGDSGGPLVANLADGPVLLGITEGGVDPCGTEPTIYTAVTPALGFLDPLIGVTPPAGSEKPRNTRRPSVLTHAGEAGRLLCKIGAWNNRPTDYTYAWYWNGRKQQVTSKAVTVARNAGGGWVRCEVTAVNAGGTSTVRSPAVHVKR
jgi:trypsin